MRALTERLKAQAYALGFDLAGVTTLGAPATVAQFDAWLETGHHAELAYLSGEGAELRRDARIGRGDELRRPRTQRPGGTLCPRR
jgi:epoxyqueuosine reductase QueG